MMAEKEKKEEEEKEEEEEEEKKCEHIVRVEDYSTGDEVCVQCGLVLSQLYCYPSNEVVLDDFDCTTKVQTKINYTIRDLCNLVHLSEEGNIRRAGELADKFELELLLNKKTCRRRACIDAYAVYHILQQNSSTYTIDDVARLSNTDSKKLWQLHKLFQEHNWIMDGPEKHVERFCYFLGLKREESIKIINSERWASCKELFRGCRPANAAAAIMYSYLIETKIIRISLVDYCKKINMPQSSVRKLYSKIST
jgi:transcription initiation factor TFIIIB Brf1 subunit/transcription initiation factor TFIIB